MRRGGLFLGSSPLVEKIGGSYRVRAPDGVAALLAAAYGDGIDAARLMPGLRLVAAALDESDLARAGIAALHLQLGALDDDRLERLARIDELLKRNFDPNQPRVPAGNPDGGQWTDAEGAGTGARLTMHSAGSKRAYAHSRKYLIGKCNESPSLAFASDGVALFLVCCGPSGSA